MSSPEALFSCLSRATRRRRARYALDGLAFGVVLSFGLGAAAFAVCRATGQPAPAWLALGMGLVAALSAVASALRPLRALRTAAAVDAHHDLPSSLATGLELASRPRTTAFEALALEQAVAHASAVDPLAPFPYRVPRATKAAAIAVALFALTSAIPPRSHHAASISSPDGAAPATLLDRETLDAFEDQLGERLSPEPTEEVRALRARVESLLSSMGDGGLDKPEALARLGEIVAEIERLGGMDPERLEATLGSMGEALGGGGARLEDTARALREARLEEAARGLREVASSLDRERVLTTRERLAMKRALAASAEPDGALEEAERTRREAEESLLERRKRGGETEEERSLLKKKERDLEAAAREEERLREDRRRLERLRRELEQAAESLGDDERRGEASEALRRAAEALGDLEALRRMASDLDALRRLAEQLRDSVRESGAGGAGDRGEGEGRGRGERMRRFSLRAAGEEPGEGQSARIRLPGQEGQTGGEGPSGGEGQAGREGQPGGESQAGGEGPSGGEGQAGRDGQSGGEGQAGRDGQTGGGGQAGGAREPGRSGEGAAGEGGEPTIDLTPTGPGERATAELELPTLEQRPSSSGGGAQGAGGDHGDGHAPRTLTEGSSTRVAHDDSQVEGTAGEGPTRSQLILGAADRGFASRGYRKVHADYSSHAEEILEDESIPPGYRYYVRRYFQLIRPRDGRER